MALNHTINVLSVAAANGYPSTIDPTVAKSLERDPGHADQRRRGRLPGDLGYAL